MPFRTIQSLVILVGVCPWYFHFPINKRHPTYTRFKDMRVSWLVVLQEYENELKTLKDQMVSWQHRMVSKQPVNFSLSNPPSLLFGWLDPSALVCCPGCISASSGWQLCAPHFYLVYGCGWVGLFFKHLGLSTLSQNGQVAEPDPPSTLCYKTFCFKVALHPFKQPVNFSLSNPPSLLFGWLDPSALVCCPGCISASSGWQLCAPHFYLLDIVALLSSFLAFRAEGSTFLFACDESESTALCSKLPPASCGPRARGLFPIRYRHLVEGSVSIPARRLDEQNYALLLHQRVCSCHFTWFFGRRCFMYVWISFWSLLRFLRLQVLLFLVVALLVLFDHSTRAFPVSLDHRFHLFSLDERLIDGLIFQRLLGVPQHRLGFPSPQVREVLDRHTHPDVVHCSRSSRWVSFDFFT